MAGFEGEWPAFVSDIRHKRYDSALQRLQAILFSRDAGSLFSTRLQVAEMLRDTAFPYLKLRADSCVEEKLDMLQFFLNAFNFTHDIESLLVVQYEALILREFMSARSPQLQVSNDEWVSFAEDCLNNGYISNAVKGYDKALFQMESFSKPDETTNEISSQNQQVDTTREMRDLAQTMLFANNVQTEATIYMKKMSEQKLHPASVCMKYDASSRYRIGIKKRNLQKLREFQGIKLGD